MQTRSKKYFQLILLILAAGSIYPLVYLRQNFEQPILTVFNMSNAELGQLYSALGLMFIVGYIPSGWLADKFAAKRMIVFSLIVTAVAGLVYAQVPDKSMLIYIYLVWGFATVFTFWSALLKAVTLLAEKNEEGKFFGALDGGRGVVEAILATIAVSIFALFVGNNSGDFASTKAGFQAVVYMYCAVMFILAALLAFVLPKGEKQTHEHAVVKTSTFKSVKEIIKIKEVWLMIISLFCGYSLFWSVYYFSGFLVVNHSIGTVLAGYVTVGLLWMRPLGGFGGGILADKFGKSRILSFVMLLASAGLVLITLIPSSFTIYIVFAMVLLIGLLTYAIRGIYWSLLEDCRVPVAATGIAIGIISFFGYLPDVVLPKISSIIYTAFGDNVAGANNMYFYVTAAIGVVGAITAYYFYLTVKKRHEQENKDKK